MDGGGAPLAPGSCPVCAGDGRFFIEQGGFDLYSCARCRTVYVHPLPSPGFLAAHYQHGHDHYFDKAAKKLRRARARIRFLRLVVSRGRFLDIGCYAGFMVEAAREAGFAASGVDLDATAIADAREHYPLNEYHVGTAESLARDQAGRYALLHGADVIEHVPDGHAFAIAAFALLALGGYFHLTTPDITHWRRPKDVRQWSDLAPPNHLVYYNPASLARLLRGAGFAIAFRKPTMKPRISLLARKPR